MMFHSDPIGLPGLAALALGGLAFVLAVIVARAGRTVDAEETNAVRGPASIGGIVAQGLGFGVASIGAPRVTLDPLSTIALGEAAAVAVLMAASVALFVTATRAMGRNWSIRARTRTDHALVQHGPFALTRNPIYLAMFLYLIALAIALGHTRQLLLAVPVFALGTVIRVRSEELLLRSKFGLAYDAYAMRVKRFVPGVL